MIDLFKNVSSYIIRKMCIKAVEVCPDEPDQYRTREMYIKALSLIVLKAKQCVKKLLKIYQKPYNLFLITLSPWGCMKEPLKIVKTHGR